MWPLLLTLTAVAAEPVASLPDDCPVNRHPVEVTNPFATSNPGYKARAGASYEEGAIPKATSEFLQVTAVPVHHGAQVRCALTVFAYAWLDDYVRGNGAIRKGALIEALAVMDRDLGALLVTEAQREAYPTWRGSNAISYLIAPRESLWTSPFGR